MDELTRNGPWSTRKSYRYQVVPNHGSREYTKAGRHDRDRSTSIWWLAGADLIGRRSISSTRMLQILTRLAGWCDASGIFLFHDLGFGESNIQCSRCAVCTAVATNVVRGRAHTVIAVTLSPSQLDRGF